MHLRPNQTELVTNTSVAFKVHQRVIMCAPTGFGKTVVFSDIARRAVDRGTVTLVLTDRIELFAQTFKSLRRASVQIQQINAQTSELNFDPHALLTVGMVETVKRRLLLGYDPKLIIVDEAHKGNFTRVLSEIYPNAKVIGATATPVGKHLPKLYTEIIQSVDIPELIADGFLSPCQGFQMQDDFSDLEVKGGEYTEQSQWSHFNDRKLYAGVVDQWKLRANGKKTIVFNVNIEHAQKMTAEFREAGVVSECITSKTDKHERKRILDAFSKGMFPVLNNCGILTTGYDEPSIECVIMNRKTKSLPLWLQCCGRGSRIYPGKTHFTVLDFGMNFTELGLWDEPRVWSLKEKKKRKKGTEAMPVKSCPQCEAMLPATARICGFCGHEFEFKESEPEQGGVMVEVKSKVPVELIGKRTNELTPVELYELQKSGRFAVKFIWRLARQNDDEYLKTYASLAGYSWGWRQKQIALRDGASTNFKIVE